MRPSPKVVLRALFPSKTAELQLAALFEPHKMLRKDVVSSTLSAMPPALVRTNRQDERGGRGSLKLGGEFVEVGCPPEEGFWCSGAYKTSQAVDLSHMYVPFDEGIRRFT